jgi:hypothetical protein
MFVSTTTMAHRHRRSPVSRLSTRAASELRRERVLRQSAKRKSVVRAIVDTNAHLDGRDKVAPVQLASDHVWHRNVRQWGPDWLEYDEYYRPVVLNPYRAAVRIVYIYQRAPRIVVIPPLARIVLEVAAIGAYSFTAVVLNAVNTAANVASGRFFGGGYFPGAGLPLPPPPPPVLRYDNVPVLVHYSQAVYEPFPSPADHRRWRRRPFR